MTILPVRARHAPPPELGLGIGFGAVTVVTGDRVAAAWAAGLAWLVVNGFLVDRVGELPWHGPADVYRAAMLTLAGVLGLLIAAVRRRRDA